MPLCRLNSDKLRVNRELEQVLLDAFRVNVRQEFLRSVCFVDNFVPNDVVLRIGYSVRLDPSIISTFGDETSDVAWFKEVELEINQNLKIICPFRLCNRRKLLDQHPLEAFRSNLASLT